MELEIEISQEVPTSKMHIIHKAGCKDLRYGWKLGYCSTKADAFAAAGELGSNVQEDIAIGHTRLANCCKEVK